MIGLALTGCDRGAPAAGSAATGGEGGAGPAGVAEASGAPVEPEDAALAYARCVRDNGFPEWPDPGPDGRMRILMGPGTGIDPNDPRLRQAMEACQDLRPDEVGTQRPGEQDAEAVEAALAFARCMRENGVADFPDPEPDGVIAGGGGRAMVGGGGAGIDRGDPRVQAAMQTCNEALPGITVR